MALGLQPVQDLQGITRLRRIDPVAVEHLEPIKDDNSILGAVGTSQHAKRVADQLLSVGLGHKSREPRILWCNLPELVVQRETGNRIHDVAEIDRSSGQGAPFRAARRLWSTPVAPWTFPDKSPRRPTSAFLAAICSCRAERPWPCRDRPTSHHRWQLKPGPVPLRRRTNGAGRRHQGSSAERIPHRLFGHRGSAAAQTAG